MLRFWEVILQKSRSILSLSQVVCFLHQWRAPIRFVFWTILFFQRKVLFINFVETHPDRIFLNCCRNLPLISLIKNAGFEIMDQWKHKYDWQFMHLSIKRCSTEIAFEKWTYKRSIFQICIVKWENFVRIIRWVVWQINWWP